MMGNMEAMQAKMREALLAINIETEAGNGAIQVKANAAREILQISVDPTLLDPTKADELEDLLLVAVNRAIVEATQQEAATTKKMMQDLLPPGLGSLAGLFK